MAAETEVRKGEIEVESCGLEVISCQDMPKVGAVCNGSSNHANGYDVKDDHDSSCALSSGTDNIAAKPVVLDSVSCPVDNVVEELEEKKSSLSNGVSVESSFVEDSSVVISTENEVVAVLVDDREEPNGSRVEVCKSHVDLAVENNVLAEPIEEGLVVATNDAGCMSNEASTVEAESGCVVNGNKVEDQVHSQSQPNSIDNHVLSDEIAADPKENLDSVFATSEVDPSTELKDIDTSESTILEGEVRDVDVVVIKSEEQPQSHVVNQVEEKLVDPVLSSEGQLVAESLDSLIESNPDESKEEIKLQEMPTLNVDKSEEECLEERRESNLEDQPLEASSELLVVSTKFDGTAEVKEELLHDGCEEEENRSVAETQNLVESVADMAANIIDVGVDGIKESDDLGEVNSEEIHFDEDVEGGEADKVSIEFVGSLDEKVEHKDMAANIVDKGVDESKESDDLGEVKSQEVHFDAVEVGEADKENIEFACSVDEEVEHNVIAANIVDIGVDESKESNDLGEVKSEDIHFDGGVEVDTVDEEVEHKETDFNVGVDESQESELVETVNVCSDLTLEKNAEDSVDVTELPLELKSESESSQIDEESSNNESQAFIQHDESYDSGRVLSSTNIVDSESKFTDVPVKNCVKSNDSDPDVARIVDKNVEPQSKIRAVPVENCVCSNDNDFDGSRTEVQNVEHQASFTTDNFLSSSEGYSKLVSEIESNDAKNNGISGCSLPDDADSIVENTSGPVGGQITFNFPAQFQSPGLIIFGSFGPSEEASLSPRHSLNPNPKVSDRAIEPSHGINESIPEFHGCVSLKNGSRSNMKSKSEDECSDSIINRATHSKDATVDVSPVCGVSDANTGKALNAVPWTADDNLSSPEADIDPMKKGGMLPSAAENFGIDALDQRNEKESAVTRPYNFLIRIPRPDTRSLDEQIEDAKLQLAEKTKLRDAINNEFKNKRALYNALVEREYAAIREEAEAWQSVRSKRKEKENVDSILKRVNNIISVEDIDSQISNKEHMIAHETQSLKEEKKLVSEIKQLKKLRGQISSGKGSQDELQQAWDKKEELEEQLVNLAKELEILKEKAVKFSVATKAIGNELGDESSRLKELRIRYTVADKVQHEAYKHLNSLKRQLYEKRQEFYAYKDDCKAANELALQRDKSSLHRLCFKQVETFLEQWNTSTEFRKEYIRNTTSRFKALDGRRLNPDEQPPIWSVVGDKRDSKGLVSTVGQDKSISLTSKFIEQVGNVSDEPLDKPGQENVSDESLGKPGQEKNQTLKKTKETAKTVTAIASAVSGGAEAVEVRKDAALTKEEQEVDREAEELKKEETTAKLKEQLRLEEIAKAKEETTAKLKEQLRLEEIAKAKEALERKKRNADKAQMRAELRARKEAELKEKEREKRLRKKEKKKAGAVEESEVNNKEDAPQSSETATETVTKDVEVVKEKQVSSKRPQKPAHLHAKQLKPKTIPPALVNRNKKRMQYWMKWIIAFVVLLAVGAVLYLAFNS